MSPDYLAVVRGVRELHKMTVTDQDESLEADAIRDAADGPWEGLSETERNRVRGLSADLYSISDPPSTEPRPMNPQAQAKLTEAIEARARGEWDRALELLRRWSKYMDPAVLSYVRGWIWTEAGDPETAVLFLEHAARFDPKNGTYLAAFLHILDEVDHSEAKTRAEEVIQHADNHPAAAVVRAAHIMLPNSRPASEGEAVPMLRRLIPVLERSLSCNEIADDGGGNRVVYSEAIWLLGLCHQHLGENQKAIDYYSRGLHTDPCNIALLVARGAARYGASSLAVTDFELAIQYGSMDVSPYYFLAHHYLISRDFEKCRVMCDRASRMPGTDSLKSELAEWSAISKAELGFPPDLVRTAFEDAIRLDPSNDRARSNLAVFEEAVRPVHSTNWQLRSAAAVRTSGLSAWRYSPAA